MKCQVVFDKLKQKLVTMPILMFVDCNQIFHVHVATWYVTLGIVLVQLGEGEIDHPIFFASKKLSKEEKNYATIDKEGFAMVHAIQKFHHYLLGSHLKFFIDHSMLWYLVSKESLGGDMSLAIIVLGVFF